MKIYDKRIYEFEQKITVYITILLAFIIGFAVGSLIELQEKEEYIKCLEQNNYEQQEEMQVYINLLKEMEE